MRIKAVFFGESFAVSDQKVCIRSLHKFKYNMQTFWNTDSGGIKAYRVAIGSYNAAARVLNNRNIENNNPKDINL